jgi:GAF domain-containing protein
MATIASVLKSTFPHFIWVGFYQLQNEDLTVGPYQGSPACLVLERHKGVCWAGVDRAEAVVVPDVHAFEGHIVCDERAASEVVIPVLGADGWICGVLDVDSNDFDAFNEVDARYLQGIVALVHAKPDTSAQP